MKRLILLSAIMLAGCSTVNQAVDAYLMKYDANEYKLATDIRTKASYAKNSCSDPVISKKNADSISYMTVTLKNYSEHLPHNKPVQEASVKLNEITQGLKTQYDTEPKVSEVFCKIKFTSIEESAVKVQQIEGSKPK